MTQRNPLIDTLRGFASIGVVAVHFLILFPAHLNSALEGLFYKGQMGVQLFYILSAYTLFQSLANHQNKKNYSFQAYLMARFFRIAPLYYLMTILYTILILARLHPLRLTTSWDELPVNLLSHFVFLNGFHPKTINSLIGVEWSIAIEMIFYLFIPILFSKINNLKKSIVALITSIIFSTLAFHLLKNNSFLSAKYYPRWDDFSYFCLPSQLPSFFMGFTLYFLLKEKSPTNGSIKIKMWGLVLIIASLTGLYLLPLHPPFYVPSFILFAALFSILIYGAFISEINLFSNSLFSFLGRISYSIYLLHLITIFIVLKIKMALFQDYILNEIQFLMTFLLSIGITALFSALTYRFIERPGIKLGKNLM